MTTTLNIDLVKTDPSRFFETPMAVCHAYWINRDEKIQILHRWEYDARELEVAEEENMGGSTTVHLDEVLDALHCLNADVDLDHSPPTKQGGE